MNVDAHGSVKAVPDSPYTRRSCSRLNRNAEGSLFTVALPGMRFTAVASSSLSQLFEKTLLSDQVTQEHASVRKSIAQGEILAGA